MCFVYVFMYVCVWFHRKGELELHGGKRVIQSDLNQTCTGQELVSLGGGPELQVMSSRVPIGAN